MTCTKHLTDLSSSAAVCASCLRERLFSLIVAQTQVHSCTAAIHQRRKNHPPLPLLFPRSVSPYVAHRKSDWSSHHNRFYSTPQLGPTYNSYYSAATTSKKKTRNLSIFSKLFRSRSDPIKNSNNRDPYQDSCETWSSFFSSIFSSRRKKQSTASYLENPTAGDRRVCWISNRGMSPERGTESDDGCDRSPWGSSCSSEECGKAPSAVRKTRNGHCQHSGNVYNLTFCLSPLVRASPNRHCNQKGGVVPDKAFSGEIGGPASKASI